MKKGLSLFLAGILLGTIGYGAYYTYNWTKTPSQITHTPSPIVIQKKKKKQKIISPDEFWKTSRLLPNSDIDVKTLTTTEKLAEAFEGLYLYYMPKIYVERFPDDFAQEGNAELFIKVMMSLILHENNMITKDRKFLEGLNKKLKNNITWNKEENDHFNMLVQKYGLTEQKLQTNQLDELLKRVDIIPPSLVVAMAGIQTNWGKKSLNAPFGQKEWINGKYTEKQFDTLGEAVHSFMMEMNTLPIYFSMWINRRTYKNLRGSLGAKLINTTDNFMRENPTYEQQIKQAFKKLKLEIFDTAVLYE
ncbi:MAG: glucosaminidase domain-containing protein [Alphaproteobacteria bacterium]|nr:glucosaminidase domain-containing protein [Alphaproteobacteria bacterium]